MLSKCQRRIILRGLKFTPTSQSSSIQLTCDLKTFDDQYVMPIDQKNESLLQGKSNLYSPRNSNNKFEIRISFINNIDITNEKSNKKSNFAPKEWTELRHSMN